MREQHLGRLLIVDDEIELTSALVDMLNKQGYQAVGFNSGQAALKALGESDFDILLTDIMMPEMDGITLLREALKIDQNLVAFMMTGQGTVQTAVEAMKNGAFDYVLKPFKLSMLLPVLDRAMEIHRLRMENVQLHETVAIYELTTTIAYSLDQNTLMNKTVEAARQQMKADEVSLMLATRAGDELYVAAVCGVNREKILGERVHLEQGIAGWVARFHEPLDLYGEVNDLRFAPLFPRSDIGPALSIPMLAGNKLVGVLNVNVRKRRPAFTLGQVKGLMILASVAAAALESAKLYTQVQEAETRYHSIFANAINGIFQSTPEGRFTLANPALVRMLGYGSPEELIASNNDYTAQIYVDPARRLEFQRLLQEAGKVEAFELQARRKDGNIIWISENVRAISDEKGNALYYEGTIEDITEHKQAEETIRELARFPTENPNPVIRFERSGRMLYANQAAIIQMADWNLGLGSPIPGVLKDNIEKVFTTGIRKTVEITSGGHIFSITIETTPGEKDVNVYGRDITASKLAEEKLGASENELRTLFAAMTDVVFVLDGEGRYLRIAPTNPINLYRPPEDMLGKTVYEVLPKEQADYMMSKIREAIQTKRTILGEYALEIDGKEILFESSTSKLSENSVIWVAHDISERRQAEEGLQIAYKRLQEAQRIGKLGSVEWNLVTDEVILSDETSELLGWGEKNKTIFMKELIDLIKPEEKDQVRKSIYNGQAVRPLVDLEMGLVRPNGKEITVHMIAELIPDQKGQPLRMVGTLQDVTERKAAEDKIRQLNADLEQRVEERTLELREAQEQLVRKEKMAVLGLLAGGVGHELRNPLGVISNAVYYLKMVQPEANEKIRKHHGIIEQELHNATRIVSDLLDYAREITTEPQPASVTELVEYTLSCFPVPASISIKIKIPADLPQVYADTLHVKQILGNLVTNACQAMATPSLDTKAGSATMSGRCKLTISAQQKKQMVAIAVKDTGTGIIPENLPKLFEPLFSTKVTGIGLGLAVSKKLAEANGGRIEVKSQAGKGSTFTLYLPVLSSDMGN